MPKTPEGVVKDVVRDVLDAHAAYTFMPVQMGYGQATLDFIGCYQGRFFAIETKAAMKKQPTTRQRQCIADIHAAGGAVFVIRGVDASDIEPLLQWLRSGTMPDDYLRFAGTPSHRRTI